MPNSRHPGRPSKTEWENCKILGCGQTTKKGAFGLCRMHYMQHRRGLIDQDGNALRPMQRVRSYGEGARCLIDGCGNRPKARGLCNAHHMQRRLGNLSVEFPTTGFKKSVPNGVYATFQCKVEGCDQRPRDHWMYSKHTQQRAAGIIDEQGNQLREFMPQGRPRKHEKWIGQEGYILVRAPEGHPKACAAGG